MQWLDRPRLRSQVLWGLERSPVTALLGPRQCGKTTLSRMVLEAHPESTFLDLENPRHQARLEQPLVALERLRGLVVLDEIQRQPGLLEVLRVLSDREPLPCRFLILGSASPRLVRGAAESLAGRVHFVDMGGFTLDEVEETERLWIRGGFPQSYLAADDKESQVWREDFIRTFLERDLPGLGVTIPPTTLRRFWTMVAHSHGQFWNSSPLASSLGVAHTTIRRYLDLLSGAFVLRQLRPWIANVKKREVKSPKVYVRDSGLLHSLLMVPTLELVESHPRLGASWEGFLVEQILSHVGERHGYFWATHSGAELDLFVQLPGQRVGFELKYTDTPRLTRSMHSSLADLDLDRLWVVAPGADRYPLAEKVEVIGAAALPSVLSGMNTSD